MLEGQVSTAVVRQDMNLGTMHCGPVAGDHTVPFASSTAETVSGVARTVGVARVLLSCWMRFVAVLFTLGREINLRGRRAVA